MNDQPTNLVHDRGSAAGETVRECASNIRRLGPQTLVSGWAVWPAVQYCNQRLVPLQYRNTAMDCFGFVSVWPRPCAGDHCTSFVALTTPPRTCSLSGGAH